MATAGQEIENPVTGERVVFRVTAEDSGGELLELDDFYTRPGQRAAPHVHPGMEESFEVIEGEVAFLIDGVERRARVGDTVEVPPGTPHVAWNPTNGQVHLRLRFRPALRWEEVVVRVFALAAEGRTDERGVPEMGVLVELLREFPEEIAPAPPVSPSGR